MSGAGASVGAAAAAVGRRGRFELLLAVVGVAAALSGADTTAAVACGSFALPELAGLAAFAPSASFAPATVASLTRFGVSGGKLNAAAPTRTFLPFASVCGSTFSTSSPSACGLAYAKLPIASATNTRPLLNHARRGLGRASESRARRTPV